MADASASLIAPIFMGKLVDSGLYGNPQDGLSDRLKERAPDGLTEAGLLAAAERIIRSRSSGAFPKFPECMAAIEACRSVKVIDETAWNRSRITRDTYHEAAKAYGRLVVIRSDEPVRWTAWRRYAESLGLAFMAQKLGPESTQREWTVPSEMPGQFDPSWVDPNPSEAFENRTQGYAGADKRKREADDLMARLPAGLRKGEPNRGGMQKKDWTSIVSEEIRDRYTGLEASEDLKAKLSNERNPA